MYNPWKEILIPERDLYTRRVQADHPLNLFWGRDSLGRYLFVYEFMSSDKIDCDLPELKGISLHMLAPDTRMPEKYILLLVLKSEKDWQLFLSLCNDLVVSTKEVENGTDCATRMILQRLNNWQDFFRKSRSEILSEEKIKGLIGELYFLNKYLTPVFGAAQAVRFWQGLENLPQDFNVNNCAIEIKCQLGTTLPHVKITSIDQLCTQLPEMFLYVLTLGRSNQDNLDSVDLSKLVWRIRNSLMADFHLEYQLFNDLLYKSGYIDSEDYLKFSYIISSEEMFSVIEGFPRICSVDLPTGITRLTYDISLNDCKPFLGTPGWMDLK